MSRAVHFSHHLCGQYTEHGGGVEFLRAWMSKYGDGVPTPFVGCHAAGSVSSLRTTTDPEQVTCRRCRASLEGRGGAVDAWSAGAIGDRFPGHREMVARAWRLCCRHRGAACPLTGAELAAYERERVLEAFHAAWDVRQPDGYDPVTMARELRERCGRLAEQLGPYVLEALRPAIAEILLAAEWHEQIEQCFGRAFALRDEALGIRREQAGTGAEQAEGAV